MTRFSWNGASYQTEIDPEKWAEGFFNPLTRLAYSFISLPDGTILQVTGFFDSYPRIPDVKKAFFGVPVFVPKAQLINN